MKIRLAAATIVAALASSAFAGHVTSRLDALAAEVADRATLDDLPRAEAKALAKAAKTLARNSKTLAADIAIAVSVEKLLDHAFLGDVTFGNDLADAVAGFRNDLAASRSALTALLAALPDGQKKDAAAKKLAGADAALADFVAQPGRLARFLDLVKAQKAIDAATKTAVGAGDWMVATVDGTSFVATKTTATAAFVAAEGGWAIAATGSIGPKSGPGERIDVTRRFVVGPSAVALGDIGQGTYAQVAGPGLPSLTWSTQQGDATYVGTLTLTTFDTAAKLMDGTFTFSGKNTADASTKTVTYGRFRAHWR